MNKELQGLEKYTISLLKNNKQVAELEYTYVFGGSKEDPITISYSEECDEETKNLINTTSHRMTIFTFGNKFVESINMRTYKPGTVSHFATLISKFESLGYEVSISDELKEVYDEIMEQFEN